MKSIVIAMLLASALVPMVQRIEVRVPNKSVINLKHK